MSLTTSTSNSPNSYQAIVVDKIQAKEEAKAWKTIWSAGQGVTSISDVKPVADLISQLKVEFEKALLKQKENYKYFF